MSVTVTITFRFQMSPSHRRPSRQRPIPRGDHRVNEGAGCSITVRFRRRELMVIDEWETAKQFQSFFDGNPSRRRHGFYRMTGPPEITVFGSIDAPGTV